MSAFLGMAEGYADPPRPVIDASALSKSFGDTVAVDGLSLQVMAGEVVGLLGPNGAGKTTTLDMLTTLASIDEGSARIVGVDVASRPRSVRRLIGLAGQSACVDEMLTARENLHLFGRLSKLGRARRQRRVEELIEQFRMTGFADRVASTYSGGERRRLDIAAALLAGPPVVFLDEPTTGLDPRSRKDVWESVRALAAVGTAVVLTTQYLEEADQLADRIIVIDNGRAVARGTPRELKASIGQEILEIELADESDLGVARSLLVGTGASTVAGRWEIHVPVAGDGDGALATLRSLEDSGVAITHFRLRQPTLDDVFLALTEEQAA